MYESPELLLVQYISEKKTDKAAALKALIAEKAENGVKDTITYTGQDGTLLAPAVALGSEDTLVIAEELMFLTSKSLLAQQQVQSLTTVT